MAPTVPSFQWLVRFAFAEAAGSAEATVSKWEERLMGRERREKKMEEVSFLVQLVESVV